jgi:uncharacterized protein
MRRLLATALAFALLGGAARAEPPVWVVTDKDSELVLFGSVHVLQPGLAWRPQALVRALARADDVWFELPVDPTTADASVKIAAKLGVLPEGQSLHALLPAADSERLARVAQAYRVSPQLLDRLRPWMAELALAGAAFRRAGAATDDGVERAIAAAAPKTARRRAFDTPAEQIAVLAETPLAEQIASLSQTLKDMEDRPDEYGRLLRAWMAGDLEALDREAIAPLKAAAPTLFKRLVTDRNAAWTEVLHRRLKGRGRTVVVVGVGHLIGPDGLPARLRALGYSVKGP